ncbi:DUF308 domain-containing protein [Mycobacterium sp. NPDC003323]
MATTTAAVQTDTWLTRYYLVRAAFSIAWVGAAVGVAHSGTPIVAALLLSYPAWDAAANIVDARHNGGWRPNPTQAFNAAVSVLTTASVAVALTSGMNAVLGVFGVWAALSGALQLATGARRWRTHGGQWPMILSGVQSTAAGVMFVLQAAAPETPLITDIAPYAAFGAFYFLISAGWLAVGIIRARRS